MTEEQIKDSVTLLHFPLCPRYDYRVRVHVDKCNDKAFGCGKTGTCKMYQLHTDLLEGKEGG